MSQYVTLFQRLLENSGPFSQRNMNVRNIKINIEL